MTTLEWAVECGYIQMITDAFLGRAETGLGEIRRNFNDDRQCFIRYAQMQQSAALREGHPESHTYIQHCLDDLGAPSHDLRH